MKKRFLQNTPLFAVLSEEERDLLSERLALCRFDDGEQLYLAGETAESMYLIKSGMVRLFEEGEGTRRMLATFGPSSVLGEIDLLLHRAHGATAVAQGAVDGWRLDRAGLTAAIADRPSISIKLSSFLGERIADVDPYLVDRLKQVSILSELDDATLHALASRLTLEEARRGSLIYQAGTHAHALYIVESGTATIVSTTPDDPEPFRQLGPGEIFGHEALIRDREYGSVARAATDVQLWVLGRTEYDQVATAHPALRQLLSSHVSESVLDPADRGAARDALFRVPFLQGVAPEILDALVERLTLRHVGTNETIYTAGDRGDYFFLIDVGVIKILDGAQLVERKESGDYFGELALLTGRPRQHTARAARNSNLWELAKRDFDAIAVRHPELTTTVSRALGERLAAERDRQSRLGVQLSMFPIFTGLRPREQADVGRRLRAMQVATNEVIYRRGSVADAFYLVKRGQIKLASDRGLFDLVRPGGFFGEMALLSGSSHSVTAQAIEESELLVLDRSQFEAVLSRYPSVSLVLSRALSSRLEAANARGAVPAAHTAAPGSPTPSRGSGASALDERLLAESAAPAEPRSRWSYVRLAAVVLALLWLAGVSAPALILDSARNDADSPFRSLIQGVQETAPSPSPTPDATATPNG